MLRARPADGGAAALILRAPAKVNLFLEVVAKRADGFHAVNTLMVAVSLVDTLEFAPANDDMLDLTCSDPALSLCLNAFSLWRCRANARSSQVPAAAILQ